MNIFFAAAEMTPFAKVGGLADVTGSLPQALKKIGTEVTILFPKYATVDEKRFGLAAAGDTLRVTLDGDKEDVVLRRSVLAESNIPVIFFEHRARISNGGVYAEPGIFPEGVNGELERFGFFAAAIAEYVALEKHPCLLHCHDWHAALSIPILKKRYGSSIKTLLTIHNLAYQGVFPRSMVSQSLGEEITSALPEGALTKGVQDSANFLASGIIAADWVSTVSPAYRNEILTPEEGAGLDGILREKSERFVGILNGIDTETWNPTIDRMIARNYDSASLENKRENKRVLQSRLGFPEDENAFLCGMVSRLTEQKGFDILLPAIPEILKDVNIQFAFLAAGDPNYAETLEHLAKQFPRHVRFINRFDDGLAHAIYAGSDAFLIPSRFEPCGLGQMIAMRYGTLPIARATGGLKDTVRDQKDGFVFSAYSREALREAIARAETVFRQRGGEWRIMQQNAMARDFSWSASARHYQDLYAKIAS